MNVSHGVEKFDCANVGVRYVYRVSVCLWKMADAKTFLIIGFLNAARMRYGLLDWQPGKESLK
jgi:hypothetical protein